MKSLCIAALTAILALCSALAHADSIPTGDPVVKTGGGGGSAPIRHGSTPSPAGIITPDFTIFSSSGTSPGTSPCVLIQGGIMTTSPTCLFENDITSGGIGLTIITLTFDAPSVPFDPLRDLCGFLSGSPFSQCGVDLLTGGGTQFSFFGGSIPFHTDFKLDFEGFPGNTSFSATAGIPEPATLSLFLGGIGALLPRRKLRTR